MLKVSEDLDPHFEMRAKHISLQNIHIEKQEQGSKLRNLSLQHRMRQCSASVRLSWRGFYLNENKKTVEEKRHNKFTPMTATSHWLDKRLLPSLQSHISEITIITIRGCI